MRHITYEWKDDKYYNNNICIRIHKNERLTMRVKKILLRTHEKYLLTYVYSYIRQENKIFNLKNFKFPMLLLLLLMIRSPLCQRNLLLVMKKSMNMTKHVPI